jgi:hypothetical protein
MVAWGRLHYPDQLCLLASVEANSSRTITLDQPAGTDHEDELYSGSCENALGTIKGTLAGMWPPSSQPEAVRRT